MQYAVADEALGDTVERHVQLPPGLEVAEIRAVGAQSVFRLAGPYVGTGRILQRSAKHQRG